MATKTILGGKIIACLTLFFSIVLIVLFSILNLIPFKFYFIIVVVFSFINLTNIFFAFKIKLNKKGRIVQTAFSILLALISIFCSFYLFKTIVFINSFSDTGVVTKNYSVMVLNDSAYKQLSDLNGKSINVFKNDSRESEVIKYLNNNITLEVREANDILSFVQSLYKNELSAIVIEDSYKELINEIDTDFVNKTRVIHTFSLEFESEDISKTVDVTDDPFVIYVSGIDTYGKISSVSRSDVNMVVVVNPKTYQILLVSIPRDFYVQLHGTTGYKDKLTHAGMYGVEMSVQTIEDLLGMDINYYFKVNFTSLIDIVDALGGIDVYSEYSFDSEVWYYFYKVYNSVNGKQALAFARARHAFIDGDRQRGKNQQAVIEAVIRKASSKAIITKYDSLLDALDGKFQTNLEAKEITSLAKLQLDKMPKWTIKSVSLNGSDSSDYTYTYSSGKLYVMIPNENSIKDVKENIQKILDGQLLESSYGDVSDIKNPGIVEVKPNVPPTDNSEEQVEDLKLTLSIDDVTVKIGETIQIVAKTTTTDIVSWISSNPSVATVSDSGLITPISEGITTITASISGFTENCIVRVTNPLDVVLPGEPESDDSLNSGNNEDSIIGDNQTGDGQEADDNLEENE